MNQAINYPIVILSGGKSSRMGSDKSLLPFNSFNTLIEYQYFKLQKIFKEVYISSKEDKFEFLEDKSKLILDSSSTYSPMVALEQILKSFENSYVFIIAVDIPFLKKDTIYDLYENIKDTTYQAIIAVDGNKNRHNLCGFYHTSVIESIDELLKKDIHKIGTLLQNINSTQIEFKKTEEFLNLNDQDQYKKACSSFSSFSI